MCILFHRFCLSGTDEKPKLFVLNKTRFKLAYRTTWTCSDCGKKITKRIGKGESGWLTLKNFLEKSHSKVSNTSQ